MTSAPGTATSGVAGAAELGRRAATACDAGRAKECLSLLDQAREMDPVGDPAPEIRKLRERATKQEANPR
jgi:hypothetical protein